MDVFTGEFYQIFKEKLTHILKLFQKFKRRKIPKFILQGQHYSNSKTKDTMRKENYTPISFMNIDTKILNKTLANQIQQYVKKIIFHDQVGFIPSI